MWASKLGFINKWDCFRIMNWSNQTLLITPNLALSLAAASVPLYFSLAFSVHVRSLIPFWFLSGDCLHVGRI